MQIFYFVGLKLMYNQFFNETEVERVEKWRKKKRESWGNFPLELFVRITFPFPRENYMVETYLCVCVQTDADGKVTTHTDYKVEGSGSSESGRNQVLAGYPVIFHFHFETIRITDIRLVTNARFLVIWPFIWEFARL